MKKFKSAKSRRTKTSIHILHNIPSIPNSNMFPTIKWSGFSKNSLQSIWPLWRTYFCIKALQLFTTYIFIFFSSVMMATQKESSTTFIFCSIFTCTWLKTTILLVVIPDSTWMTFYLLWHREKPCCTRKSTFN